MNNLDNIKEKYGNAHPFVVPDNYFERLTEVVMVQLPEKNSLQKSSWITIWRKAKPVLYAAAMLAIFFWSLDTLTRKKTVLPTYPKQGVVAVDEEIGQDISYLMTSVDDFSLSEYMSEDSQQ